LIYAKDICIWEGDIVTKPYPATQINFYKDALATHFHKLILAHSLLRVHEKDHTKLCNCHISLDHKPKIQIYFENVRTIVRKQDRTTAPLALELSTLSLFEYLL